VATATVLAAVTATAIPMRKQRIGFLGFGSAGIGIANLLLAAMKEDGLSDEEARKQFYAVDRHGLIVEGQADVRSDQAPFAQRKDNIKGWSIANPEDISLLDVARNARLTILIGVSGQGGAFTEEIVREMAKHADRPVIFPLSNPTILSEAVPEDLFRWTNGRALIGTGSPFPPVQLNGKTLKAAQTNNSYIFPGLALGILTSRATRVTDAMIMASAKALAALSPTQKDKNADLLPPLADSRKVSLKVAEAVGKQAIADGVSALPDSTKFKDELVQYVWDPVYVPYERIKS
jgi:malate dehydrogenase (oxaloacetate-decarboxylating)